MPGVIDAVFNGCGICTCGAVSESDEVCIFKFCIFAFFKKIKLNIFAVNFTDICQCPVKVSINRSEINRLCCIVNISISILCFIVFIYVFTTDLYCISSIGCKSRKNNCAVCLLYAFFTADKVIATVIEIACKSQSCCGCCGCGLFKYKNCCYCITACFIMELTVAF